MLRGAIALVGAGVSLLASPALATPGDLAAYMKARAADADGHAILAAQGYDRALTAAPDSAPVAIRAYRQGLEAGDIALVDRAIAMLTKSDAVPEDAGLILVAKAARRGDGAATNAAIAMLDRGALALLRPALSGWAAFAAGGDPIAPLRNPGREPVARRFADENRALLLISTGRVDDGAALLRVLLSTDTGNLDLRIIAAQLLAGAGRPELAQEMMSSDQPALIALRTRLGRGLKPTLALGVSRIFTRVAAELANEPGSLSITLTRAALLAEPDNDRARLLLANALAAARAPDQALALIDMIPADSIFAATAQTGRIQILTGAGDAAGALAAARALAQPDDARTGDIQRLGDLLLAARRYDEAAAAYDRVLTRGGRDDWAAWLQYGGALDQAKRWPAARIALERAVALGPTQPLALNYLGYARLEHREDVARAQVLLETASRLKPDDAGITDSLGWAYHLRGQSLRAVPLLERAAAGAPDNAEISDHLGDALWATGRRYEARYAWSAAAIAAEGDDVARLTAKARSGPLP